MYLQFDLLQDKISPTYIEKHIWELWRFFSAVTLIILKNFEA